MVATNDTDILEKPKINGCQRLATNSPETKEKTFFCGREMKQYKEKLELKNDVVDNPAQFNMNEREELFVKNILNGEPWTLKEVLALNEEDRIFWSGTLTKSINTLAGRDRDMFIKKVDGFLGPINKRNYWEQNHSRILKTLHKMTIDNCRIPSRMEIAEKTGLSRQTVDKHLKEYFGSEEYRTQQEDYLVLREKLIACIYDLAVGGNIKAARLFFEVTTINDPQKFQIQNHQNNFIQINGASITKDQIEHLPEEKQKQLMEIIDLISKPI